VEHTTTEFIRRFIPEAVLVESFASELTYQLPDDVLSVRKFDALFTGLDSELKQLGITGYGVSSTSLEEVNMHYLYTELNDTLAVYSVTHTQSFIISLNLITSD